jgi:hypothetical protein
MLDLKQYKRFFAFGCSMTQYFWPTWADVIAQEIPESYNYGQSGGGNLFISCQVTEANVRHQFNKDDLVIIMWSGVSREDRYVNNNWLTPGNIYSQGWYDDEFVKKFADTRGYLLRDLSLITMCKGMLDNIDTNYYMLNMAPFTHLQNTSEQPNMRVDDVLQHFESTTSAIKTDILTAELNGKWPQHPIANPGGYQTHDYHPSTRSHANYLQKVFPGLTFEESTKQFIDKWETIITDAWVLTEIQKHKHTTPPHRL